MVYLINGKEEDNFLKKAVVLMKFSYKIAAEIATGTGDFSKRTGVKFENKTAAAEVFFEVSKIKDITEQIIPDLFSKHILDDEKYVEEILNQRLEMKRIREDQIELLESLKISSYNLENELYTSILNDYLIEDQTNQFIGRNIHEIHIEKRKEISLLTFLTIVKNYINEYSESIDVISQEALRATVEIEDLIQKIKYFANNSITEEAIKNVILDCYKDKETAHTVIDFIKF